MKILLSPAKTLNETLVDLAVSDFTQPIFWDQAKQLAEILQTKSPTDIQSLMHVSEKIADLNVGRYQTFPNKLTDENAYPALHCFQGDVYRGIDEQNFTSSEWQFAQKHVRILSGLYGVLRPLDLMYPYRLEMATKLVNPRGKNLYEWWADQVTEQIDDDLIINLASQEYFSVINPDTLTGKFINVHFKENKDNTYKVVAIHAKRARGVMTNWIIKRGIVSVEDLKKFDKNDYIFNLSLSDKQNLVFTR